MHNENIFCISSLVMVLAICFILYPVEAEPISVSSNNDVYYMGDYIVVFGQIETIFENVPVTVQIYHESTLIDVDQIPVAKDGTYATTFKADGKQWETEGLYSVRAFYTETVVGETTFQFYKQISNQASAAFPVDIPNSGTFDVGYTIRGGEVKDIEMSMERYSILVQTSMDTSGNLILKLPRESFDAQSGGTDESFIVLISKENTSAENFANVDYEEVGTGSDYRTIRIPLEEDDKWVEVVGTYVIPEFGSIAIIILVVAVSSAIIISKNRLSIRYN